MEQGLIVLNAEQVHLVIVEKMASIPGFTIQKHRPDEECGNGAEHASPAIKRFLSHVMVIAIF